MESLCAYVAICDVNRAVAKVRPSRSQTTKMVIPRSKAITFEKTLTSMARTRCILDLVSNPEYRT